MAENRRTCASCGTPNEEDARFCEGCGAALARECATCGVEANATARFCRGCGAPLDDQVTAPDISAAGPSRKTVTVMFADLAGSTTFEENVDAETAREVIGRYHELLRATAQRHRAGVTKYIGDGFMAVWGVPEIGPDDAAHAIDAAVELQERFVDLAAQVAKTHRAELALRVAVNTGEVVVGDGDADLVGDALNVGARLEAECPRGRVVVGEETWRATRGRYSYESLGQVQVKGRSAPVAVYQWLDRQSESADAAPFVGRSNEVRRLQAVLDDAIASRAARLVTVVGDPGVGKSRLAAEFTAAQGDVCVIEARCAVEGTVALRPIVEVLRVRDLETDIPASVPERDRLLRDLNGLMAGVAGSVEENFWALRRFVEVLASGGSVLLVLDDIQWAGTLLLDFMEHLVEWVQEVPVLVLALARPELREIRPELVTVSRWVSEAIPLNGLDARATAELAANVLGAAQLPDELLRRLPSSTGGNPLFVRELIGMLAHDGVLVEQPSGWRLTIDVDAIAIPPTIHALLASRLERLDAADRRVLEIAAVVGSDFSVGTVRALAGTGADGVKRSLDRLRRLDLAQPSGAYIGDEPVWRFHHVLIRDVAYRRLLKSDRADLHERLADWVAAGGASVAFDTDELIARHLEAARTYRLELGHDNEHTGDLALRAARHYVASARRALDRDELVSAGSQAARGAALANADPAAHAELLLTGCEAFLSAGDVAAGAPLVDELERISDASLEPWAACYRCQFIVYTAPERLLEVDARLQSAIDEFGRRNDAAGLAKAHRVRASARFRLGRVGDAEVDLFEALIAARQSGDHRQITAALGAAPGAALWGPSPVPKAGGRCLDVVRMQRMTTAAPSLEATSMRHLAVLELLRGRPDKARTMLGDARQLVEDLGLRHGLMETELFAGIIESMEGDPVAAEPHFRTALEGLDALGVGADAGLAAALLARSVLAQGRIDEADRHATESERLAGRNLKTAIAWRAVRAEILAARGRHAEAAAVARDAVTVAAGTDLVIDHADACLALSRVLTVGGDIKAANGAREDAERLYAAKEVASTIGRRAEPVASEMEGPVQPDLTTSRLAVANESCRRVGEFENAMRAHDVDGVIACYADAFVVDDRRRISAYSVRDRDALREALTRLFEDYTRFEFRVIAVRGQRLNLIWSRFSDEDGNQTATLDVGETDGDGRFRYHGRFDEDDFEGACREFEKRYYAGEGAAFAGCANAATLAPILLNRNEFDRFITELCTPDLHVENRSRSAIPDRSAKGLIASFRDLQALTSVARTWISAARWLAPTVSIVRLEREAVGHDGEEYAWTRILVCEFRDGRFASMCEFDIEDEESAFAYAEELSRQTPRRLAVTNRSCEYLPSFLSALHVHDIDGTLNWFSDDFVYDDRRKLGGDPIVGREAMRAAIERIFTQYSHFDIRVLAVRGQGSHMLWTRWSDDDGNETTTFYVNETDDDGRLAYHARFDEDDFEGAYREFERRYYAGEGAAFADGGTLGAEWVIALNQGDFDLVFDELTAPGMRVENRSQSLFGDRSASELRATFEDLNDTVASARIWVAATCWVSPELVIARFEREAMGQDGEIYAWTRIHVAEIRDGQVASSCRFEIDDEEAAFAYAEARLRASNSRLAVANRATQTATNYWNAMRALDVDGALECCADQLVYDDRRRVSGDPVRSRADLRAACERLFAQYTQFESRTLAVRGENLHLTWSRSYNDAGYETTCLHVSEIGDDGRFIYEGRFDQDDFETALRELEKRYYTGEASEFAEVGALQTEWMITVNAGDFDRLFGELSTPDLRVENRNRAFFPDRSAAEFRESLEELSGMVGESRTWNSALRWLSPSICICRNEREAIGSDGEQYTWSRISVAEIRHGRVASLCHFAFDDEEAAFAYAEERVQATMSRLGLTNQATRTMQAFWTAMRNQDVDGTLECCTEGIVHDDRRSISGDPIVDRATLRAAIERILEQYTDFEASTLAVRGAHLQLGRSRWSNSAGLETTYLHVVQTGEDGRFEYEARFDEDDFETAYRELEKRYYARQDVAFAAAGLMVTEWALTLNRDDFDTLFDELSAPDLRIVNRSRSAFPDRSAAEYRATLEELAAIVVSSRSWSSVLHWVSPTCSVARCERHAVGEDGGQYAWSFLIVFEVRDGRVASMCEFDLDDEEAAFAYAEERMRTRTSRLALMNRASETADAIGQAMRAADADGALAYYAHTFTFDDRRRLSGDPVEGAVAMRTAAKRVLEQYTQFETHTLAVRGEHLHLFRNRFQNNDGFETTYLFLYEIGDDGHVLYEGRFDEDDFEGAYRELEKRYFAGEGAAFADTGPIGTEITLALSAGDLDRAFGEFFAPDFRIENRSSSVFSDRSATELRATFQDLHTMVTSVKTWQPAVCWLSPNYCVGRTEREAIGPDGEQYAWTRLHVFELRNGRLASMCEFELGDEEQAFAHAEERVRADASRLALRNKASETIAALARASQVRDLDAMFGWYSDGFTYDDRRRLSGNPITTGATLRFAQQRILEQYSHFDFHTLAVRGERLHLWWGRWSNESGFETAHLFVHEVGIDGRVVYEGRFDEDDFESAYRELERRYYAGEGAAFAEAGATATDWVINFNRSEFDRVFDELTSPELSFENRSRSAFPDRSARQFRESVEELDAMVASSRTWHAVVSWLSPAWVVVRQHREAVGHDGEKYEWLTLQVSEVRDGRLQSICQFEIEDEEAAFAYANERVRASASRLALTNRASPATEALARTSRAADVDATVGWYADTFVFDDRRRLSGDPVSGMDELRAATQRIFDQYGQFSWRTLAVRGTRLHLSSSRWSDDAGNETGYLHLREVGDDGRFTYDARFDADDFDGAYRELERRYYTGEGAAFAESGAIITDYTNAYNEGDFDKLFGDLTTPGMQFENRSRTVFPDRSVDEFRASVEELSEMVSSVRSWSSAICWMSTSCCISRNEREAIGQEGERYSWTTIYVTEVRNGRAAAVRQYDLDDEEAAFAYAEERVRAATSRLAVTNRSCEFTFALGAAMRDRDVDGIMRCMSDRLVYDDHRRLTGDPITELAEFRVAFARIMEQYSHFEWHVLAVRGERLNLYWSRWSDVAGNETTYLHVVEIDDDGQQVYEGRFDEDDFEGAYRELELRYYASEGAAFAEAGKTTTDWVIALNQGDFDRAFGELSTPEMRVQNRSLALFPDRTSTELRTSFEELSAIVSWSRTWISAMRWVSPTWIVFQLEREAVGHDGEDYRWLRLHACDIQNGRLASVCQFEIDDEGAAFAYAEERALAVSRLAVTNRASDTGYRVLEASEQRDIDAVVGAYSDHFTYDDRRRLSGDPVTTRAELRAAVRRILEQYSHFEARTLAVRGERLQLAQTRWSDDAGNETVHLQVMELDDDGRIDYQAAFDEDDFEGAYRELTKRYCAGEGAAVAHSATIATEWLTAMNRGDFDRAFGELLAPGMHILNRSSSAFPDRSVAEFRASFEALYEAVATVRSWSATECWLSPTCGIGRHEREAVGRDGERYAWTRLVVFEVRDGRNTSMCVFELEDEEAAFAYAEERVRATASRLPVANQASRVWNAVGHAMRTHNADAATALFADHFDYDDRWAVGGDAPDEVRTAVERIFDQYSEFEGATLAVRGDTLQLARSRWSNKAGYETSYLHVTEIDGDGRITYYGRFGEDDFEGAYSELDRRYYDGEGAAFAEAGAAQTEWLVALNRGDLNRLFGELTAPDMRFQMRSSSAFPDSSPADARAAIEDFNTTVASAQTWHSAVRWVSPTFCVTRNEREAIGRDGEQYAWTRLAVVEFRDGRMTSECEFELDDEEAAFAYAEERGRATGMRLAVINSATQRVDALMRAALTRDADAMADCYSEGFEYDDRRKLSGNPIRDLRATAEQILSQYSQFEACCLAVRGKRLQLARCRWSNDSGFETTHLIVNETGEDGRFVYEGRFDEDDFEGAYRALEERYYAGEGAAYADAGRLAIEYILAVNSGDASRLKKLTSGPGFRVENRTRSGFGERSGAELLSTYEELRGMVASVRTWLSALCWVAPRTVVGRFEREATGSDGEKYAWTRIDVAEIGDDEFLWACQFEVDDEAAAFAYAEEQVRRAEDR